MIENVRIGLLFPELAFSDQESYFDENTKHIFSQEVRPGTTFFPLDKDQLFTALENDVVDVVATTLEFAPYVVPESCRYIALFENNPLSPNLRVMEQQYAPSEDLKILPGTLVGVPDEVSGLQLTYLNPVIQIKVIDGTILNNPDLWSEQEIQAGLVLFSDSEGPKDNKNLITVPLHPGEFLRSPGSGKIVFAAHRESIPVSKFIFDTIHTAGLTAITNNERKIAKHFADRSHLIIKTYCRKDERNYYHLKAGLIDLQQKKYFQHTMSQSTHFKLAEKMIDVLESLSNLS